MTGMYQLPSHYKINNSKWMVGNYSTAARTYSNWESQLIDMKVNPEKYSKNKQSFIKEVRDIQSKMRDIRKKIESAGATCAISSMETWNP